MSRSKRADQTQRHVQTALLHAKLDVHQVVAALANVSAKTLLMVEDVHERVDIVGRGGRRATFNHVALYGLEEDGEEYDTRTMSVALSSTAIQAGGVPVPEARPWYEWCRGAENGVLDLCRRCGTDVCDYMKHCFDFAHTSAWDSAVAINTKFQHVFFDGGQWHCSPVRHGEEVG